MIATYFPLFNSLAINPTIVLCIIRTSVHAVHCRYLVCIVHLSIRYLYRIQALVYTTVPVKDMIVSIRKCKRFGFAVLDGDGIGAWTVLLHHFKPASEARASYYVDEILQLRTDTRVESIIRNDTLIEMLR
jgi:hypothetical protein